MFSPFLVVLTGSHTTNQQETSENFQGTCEELIAGRRPITRCYTVLDFARDHAHILRTCAVVHKNVNPTVISSWILRR